MNVQAIIKAAKKENTGTIATLEAILAALESTALDSYAQGVADAVAYKLDCLYAAEG